MKPGDNINNSMEKNLAFELKSAEETIRFGKALGAEIKMSLLAGDNILPQMITLTGGLGAGKTTFCQGLCAALEVPENQDVVSPTFTLANEYNGLIKIFHLDVYRLDEKQFYEAGLDEYMTIKALMLVEWPDKLPKLHWPAKKLDLFFSPNEEGRSLTMSTQTTWWQEIWRRAAAAFHNHI